jgi:excinuclease ABC subunit C
MRSRTLRSVIGLPSIPRRIECFDISTIQGSETVASMVVCEDGRMKKSEYRKFRVKSQSPDPRAKPKSQVPGRLRRHEAGRARRYRKVLEDGGPFPDLILIDGGKGQLSAAYEALSGNRPGELVAVGIAKREEVIFTRDQAEPIVLPTSDPALLLVQRIPRRGAPLRRDVPSQGALDARSALGTG